MEPEKLIEAPEKINTNNTQKTENF